MPISMKTQTHSIKQHFTIPWLDNYTYHGAAHELRYWPV